MDMLRMTVLIIEFSLVSYVLILDTIYLSLRPNQKKHEKISFTLINFIPYAGKSAEYPAAL